MSVLASTCAVSNKRSWSEYSCEPDLIVVVEDQQFAAHSLVLMLASPVFKAMLLAPMGESAIGRIQLPGKCKDEYRTFYRALLPGRECILDFNSAVMLSRWANEYEVEGLKSRCELYLLADAKRRNWTSTQVREMLLHSLLHRLSRLNETLLSKVRADLPFHIDTIETLIANGEEEVVREMYPGICVAAGLEKAEPETTPLRCWMCAIPLEGEYLGGGVYREVRSCSRCSRAHYCSRDCQRSHWPSHKGQCCTHRPSEHWPGIDSVRATWPFVRMAVLKGHLSPPARKIEIDEVD